MKSFWISLLFFILFMCACKTKKVGSEVDFTTKENVQTEQIKYQALVDTTSVLKIFKDNSKMRIIETITITEYDKESGKPIKKTDAKREIVQDTDQVASQEEQKAVVEQSVDSISNNLVTETKSEAEIQEESIGGQESLGQWLGIILGIGILIFFVFLWGKIKKWLHL